MNGPLDMAMTLLCAAALMLSGSNLGIHVVTQMALFPLLRYRLDDSSGVKFWQALDHYMARRMPPFMRVTMGTVLLTAAAAAWRGDTPLALGAFACLVALVADTVFTVRKHLPINQLVQSWDAADPPASWIAVRERQYGHFRIRGAVALVACLCLEAGVLLSVH